MMETSSEWLGIRALILGPDLGLGYEFGSLMSVGGKFSDCITMEERASRKEK
jgi:hypothetical protein